MNWSLFVSSLFSTHSGSLFPPQPLNPPSGRSSAASATPVPATASPFGHGPLASAHALQLSPVVGPLDGRTVFEEVEVGVSAEAGGSSERRISSAAGEIQSKLGHLKQVRSGTKRHSF